VPYGSSPALFARNQAMPNEGYVLWVSTKRPVDGIILFAASGAHRSPTALSREVNSPPTGSGLAENLCGEQGNGDSVHLGSTPDGE
jgi:hypothetical protein